MVEKNKALSSGPQTQKIKQNKTKQNKSSFWVNHLSFDMKIIHYYNMSSLFHLPTQSSVLHMRSLRIEEMGKYLLNNLREEMDHLCGLFWVKRQ